MRRVCGCLHIESLGSSWYNPIVQEFSVDNNRGWLEKNEKEKQYRMVGFILVKNYVSYFGIAWCKNMLNTIR